MLQMNVDLDAIGQFCRKHSIRKMAFYGSVLRDDFRPDSDVDVLVEFAERAPGLMKLARMQSEMSEMLEGRRIDLHTFKSLNHRLRERVLNTSELIYAEG